MRRQVVTDKAPQAAAILSQAIVSNGLVFVAGQVANKTDGSMVEGSTEEKFAQVMQNVQEILIAADTNIGNAVKVTIYVTDMTQMPDINKAYPSYFTDPYPAREAVCVKELPLSATIEVSVIAVKE